MKTENGPWFRLPLAVALSGIPCAGFGQSIEELRDMPISALANLDVTSVTKGATSLSDTPGSLFVITHDNIVRSGTITLPGILRLAPNLQVMRGSPDKVVIGARGLGGNESLQSFSNKLLVMIDGRSVYTPLYSGVYWDMQDVLPEDVDRIEVLSGPGATLWGANAVNGVINITTRNAGATQGLYGTGVVGNRTYDVGLRYGGAAGDAVNYRVFAKRHQNFESGKDVNDGSRRTQGGFRVDWSPSASDTVMIQGDGYFGSRSQGTIPDDEIEGYDLVARWDKSWTSGDRLKVQAYYDHARRQILNGDGSFAVNTFDLDVQHNFSVGDAHSVVWGGGARFNHYTVHGIPNLEFVPNKATLFLANLFIQDSVAITPRLIAIAGIKLEHGPYGADEFLPTARLSWRPDPSAMLWAAVSRAVRSPTPFDKDVLELGETSVMLSGTKSFRAEKLTAFEAGTRLTPWTDASISISGFYNDYDDLRTVEPASATDFYPLHWGNGLAGYTYGLDSWADIRVADWWRLKPGYSLLITRFHFKEGSIPLVGTSQAGNDPKHRASLRSSMDLGPQINFDMDLRFVGALPDPHVASYVELGARLGWQFTERAELSVSGFNLLHDQHQELPLSDARPAGRSIFAALKWTL